MKKAILILSLMGILVYAGCNDDPGHDRQEPIDTTRNPPDTIVVIDTTTVH